MSDADLKQLRESCEALAPAGCSRSRQTLALIAELDRCRELIRDLWSYLDGNPWGVTSAEEAACENETFAALHARMTEIIGSATVTT